MPLIDIQTLRTQLCPPLDPGLTESLLNEFRSLERRFVLRDWEPAELDGGQFAEVLARVLYHQDSGTLNMSKAFDECLAYIQDDKALHKLTPRRDAIHISLVLRAIYKMRSQRGAVHISATYSANEMDSKIIIESARWCLCETLRTFWNGDREAVARAVRELVQFDVPSVGKFGDTILVQRPNLSVDTELLVLLHYAGEVGYSRGDVGKHIMHPASTITDALKRLCSAKRREVVKVSGGNYRLTDLGSKRVRENMADLLVLTT
jgi:hypothetical protein